MLVSVLLMKSKRKFHTCTCRHCQSYVYLCEQHSQYLTSPGPHIYVTSSKYIHCVTSNAYRVQNVKWDYKGHFQYKRKREYILVAEICTPLSGNKSMDTQVTVHSLINKMLNFFTLSYLTAFINKNFHPYKLSHFTIHYA